MIPPTRYAIAALALSAVLSGAAPVLAQSFTCATNTAPDERAVCADCELAQLDVKMSVMYDVLAKTAAMGNRADLRDTQRAWLATRSVCGSDAVCLRGVYRARIGELQRRLDALYSRGPF